MPFQERGYKPRTLRLSIDSTGREVLFRFQETADQYVGGHSAELRFVTDQNLRVFWTENDFNNDQNFMLVTAAQGPVLIPADARQVWLKAASTTANVELTAFLRG